MTTVWYQITASKFGTDEVKTCRVEVASNISSVVAALGKYGWLVYEYHEIDKPQVGNPFLGKKV